MLNFYGWTDCIVVYTMVADPGVVDPDPDPTFKKKPDPDPT